MFVFHQENKIIISTSENILEMIDKEMEDTISHLFIEVIDNHNSIITEIIVPEEERNNGIGTKLMEVALATIKTRNVLLNPTDIFGSDLNRLIDFYGNFGFKLITNRRMILNRNNIF